jgi:pilus assembly protein FimV
VQLKLLEVYAGRKDKSAFGKLAGDFSKLTGGTGSNWLKAAAMGFALDPANRLYEAGKDAAPATVVGGGVGGAADIDLDLGGGGTPRTSTDIMLDAGAADAAMGMDTAILNLGAATTGQRGRPAAPMPDFTLEVPPAGAGSQADIVLEAAPPARDSNVIDFHIDLPPDSPEPVTLGAAPGADAGLDFKLEGLDLSLEGEQKSAAAIAEKNGHWYDVQTKFDLAKAYQEMGDRDGAKEILQEVIKEGDAEQQVQAKTLLASLG